jgi:hypothetical protein
MASYELLASETTRQVLSATVTEDVEYCTIRTSPSGVICNSPVNKVFFEAGTGGTLLGQFADSVETVMAFPEVIAGTGVQTIDQNGLLADSVVFTVQYIPPGSTTTGITAEVEVPVIDLNFSNQSSAGAEEAAVNKLIQAALANLKAAAGSGSSGVIGAAPKAPPPGPNPSGG